MQPTGARLSGLALAVQLCARDSLIVKLTEPPWRALSQIANSPNWIDCVGHDFAQAGSYPSRWRSKHIVHFQLRPSSSSLSTTP